MLSGPICDLQMHWLVSANQYQRAARHTTGAGTLLHAVGSLKDFKCIQ